MPNTYKILQQNSNGSGLIEFNFLDGTSDTKTVNDLSDQGIAQAAKDSQDIISVQEKLPSVTLEQSKPIPVLDNSGEEG